MEIPPKTSHGCPMQKFPMPAFRFQFRGRTLPGHNFPSRQCFSYSLGVSEDVKSKMRASPAQPQGWYICCHATGTGGGAASAVHLDHGIPRSGRHRAVCCGVSLGPASVEGSTGKTSDQPMAMDLRSRASPSITKEPHWSSSRVHG